MGDQYVLPDGTVGDLGHCRACPAKIVWVITKLGRKAPMNKDGTSHFGTCPGAGRIRRSGVRVLTVADGTLPAPARGAEVTADGARGMTRGR